MQLYKVIKPPPKIESRHRRLDDFHISGSRLTPIEEFVTEDNHAIAHSIELELVDFLRQGEIDLTNRSSVKSAKNQLSNLIKNWNIQHPSRPIADEAKFTEVVLRNLIGYGPIEPLLEDDAIWEISVNGPKEIFCKRHGDRPFQSPENFHDVQHLERVISRMLETSIGATRQLDPSLGIQDAQLPDGTRLHIVHPELTNNYSYAISIRKFAKNSLSTIREIVECGSLSEQAGDFLYRAVSNGATILISGAPGSGKTTLLNSLIDALPGDRRVIAIEETPEVRISKPDKVQLHTRADRLGREEISLRRLVKASLRMNSEVLILGEVRDQESLPLLLSLSTGIQGMTTLHAVSAKDALIRLRMLIQLSFDHEIPLWVINQIIADAIDLVVQLKRTESGIVVEEVTAVEEGSKDSDSGFITTDIFSYDPLLDTLRFSGRNPLRMSSVTVDPSFSQSLERPRQLKELAGHP